MPNKSNKDAEQDAQISKLKTKVVEMREKIAETRNKVDEYAKEHPWKVAGYVAGASALAGLFFGYLIGRKK